MDLHSVWGMISVWWALLFSLLNLSACATYQALPPPRIDNFYIRPLDPPVQGDDEKICVPIGFDGLACRDAGMRI